MRGAGFTRVFIVEAAGDPLEIAERVTHQCAACIGHATAVLAEEMSAPERIREAAIRVGLEHVGPEETFCFRLRKRGSHFLAAPTPQLEVEIGSAIWLALEERYGKRPKVDLTAPDVLVIAEVLGPIADIGIVRKAWTKPGPAPEEEGPTAPPAPGP